MKNMINKTHIEGYLYEHDLAKKVSGPNSKNPNTEFITGTVSIATDDAGLNIVPVHFTYVTAVTGSGKPNATYATLDNIVSGTIGAAMKVGKENAGKLRIDSAVGLNEFYSDRGGTEELVSAKRNEGGFVHVVDAISDDEKTRNTFECDMLITGVKYVDADDERGLPEKAIIKGCTFDFRKSMLPVEFTALNPNAISYFQSLDASNKNPTFTKVWGRQISQTITKVTTEESAFGEASVKETKSTRRDWVITGAKQEPYLWDDESSLTAAEMNACIKKRETDLAAMKARQDEYKASKGNAIAQDSPASGTFNF